MRIEDGSDDIQVSEVSGVVIIEEDGSGNISTRRAASSGRTAPATTKPRISSESSPSSATAPAPSSTRTSTGESRCHRALLNKKSPHQLSGQALGSCRQTAVSLVYAAEELNAIRKPRPPSKILHSGVPGREGRCLGGEARCRSRRRFTTGRRARQGHNRDSR